MEDYILDNWDKWTHNKIRSIAEEILFAIRDIHMVSLIHGDITPRNFVQVKGSLKIIDFGLTRALPPTSSNIMIPINQVCKLSSLFFFFLCVISLHLYS